MIKLISGRQWRVIADDIDETITPYEYSIVVFKMFADFLLTNYKKFDKVAFDELLVKLDREYIESFGSGALKNSNTH